MTASTGIHSRSISSRAIQSVRIARFSTEVYARSNVNPSAFSSSAAVFASCLPLSLRSTSTHPVNRFSRFQSLSPCRSSTTRCIEAPFRL